MQTNEKQQTVRDQMMTEETREAFSLFDKDNRDASELGFHHEVRGLYILRKTDLYN